MCLANENDSREKKLAVRKLKREGASRTTDQESSHKSAFSPDSATTSRRLPSTAQSRSQKGETRRRRGRRPAPSLLTSPLGDPLSALEGKGWEPGKGRKGPLLKVTGVSSG